MTEKELVNEPQDTTVEEETTTTPVEGEENKEEQPSAPEVKPMGTTQKLLIRRDKNTGLVMSQQLLFDDVDTEHIIIDELPEVEIKPGFTHEYVVDAEGKVTVKYTEIPKTTEQLLMETNAKLMLEVAQIKAQLNNQTPPVVGGAQ